MHSPELIYRIGVTLLNGVGDVLAKNLIAYCGSAEQVFKTKKSHLEKIPGIGQFLAKSISNHADALKRAEEEISFIEKNDIRALFFTDDAYPQRLKHCHDSPILLYYKGNANLNQNKIISIVGSRTPSPYGKQMTEKLLEELAETDCMVVSGLAYGIDITAHKAAIKNNLSTIGVLAHGLDRIYPSAHEQYAKNMLENGGLLTEFMSQTNPDKENFPKRNRIVAGMCDAVIVMESKKEGGSLITATIANGYNKDVFAFPGKAGDPLSEGCNGLIKTNKAHLIESSADLLYIMNWNEQAKAKPSKQIPLLLNLTPDEQKIIDVFENKSQLHIDEVCYATQIPVSKISSHLLNLEFSNIVKSLPGKMYELNR